MRNLFMPVAIVLLIGSVAAANPPHRKLVPIGVPVGKMRRGALAYIPARATKTETPVLFAFHGHGGSAANAAVSFNYQAYWPEAVVVYMQGLPTPSIIDPEGKKAGWQNELGQVNNRDLRFFDATLAMLQRNCKIDESRIFAAGHSNGGGFTYLLWAARHGKLTAVAPSAASGANRFVDELKPLPVLHIAGENDPIVVFANQKRLMQSLLKVNGCSEEGTPWKMNCTMFASEQGTPVYTFVHQGDHTYPAAASRLTVEFFKHIGQEMAERQQGSE